MRVGLIGCGRVGRKRAAAVAGNSRTELVIAADVDRSRAEALAAEYGGSAASDWHDVIARDDVDAVIVAAVNSVLAPATLAAAEAGKHVLCEKPLGRNPGEARAMVDMARRHGVVLKTGFNHRHHPLIRRAHELCAEGRIGPPLFVRGLYGHGGRPGYEQEWRANPEIAGGGELLDQGIHLIDLARWFVGEFSEVACFTARYVWSVDPLEDNGFLLMRTPAGQIASLHASWTQWKNRFSFEVFGEQGFVAVEGLGGSYGRQRLICGRRASGQAPLEEVVEHQGPDESWSSEWAEFVAAVAGGRTPMGDGVDGLQAMRLVFAAYEAARCARVVHLES